MRWLPVTSLALVGATAALAACADDVGCPGADSFALTAPDGFAELVPGASVTIRWRADDDPGALVQLRAIASDGVADVALAPARPRDLTGGCFQRALFDETFTCAVRAEQSCVMLALG